MRACHKALIAHLGFVHAEHVSIASCDTTCHGVTACCTVLEGAGTLQLLPAAA